MTALDGVGLATDVAVWRALEVAGKRLLTRPRRAQYLDVPPWLLHTRIPVAEHDLDRLMTGAWTCLRQALDGAELPIESDRLVDTADEYVRALLVAGQAHEARWLARALERGGACGRS